MPVEQRGWVTNVGSGQLVPGDRHREEPDNRRKAAVFAWWHEPDDARVSRPDVCPVKASPDYARRVRIQ